MGTASKLSGGGGEAVCHSSPREFHGLPVTRFLTTTVDQTKLITKIRIEKPSTNEEIDTQSFRVVRLRAYSKTRRGWPARPTAKSGRNVELNATNISQNWILPSFSSSEIPSI